MNISLFAHIELDSELSGRFGVQGNIFSNTFGYLNDYFKTLPDLPPQVTKLAAAMDALVVREKQINALRVNVEISKRIEAIKEALPSPAVRFLDWIGDLLPQSTLDTFLLDTTTQINALLPNQDLLLPGGWRTEEGGHAMIYQFDAMLNFSLNNSGPRP